MDDSARWDAVEEAAELLREREFNAACFNLKKEDLPALKKDIVTFKNEMIKKYASPQGDETYQLQLQLFPYTQPTGENQP